MKQIITVLIASSLLLGCGGKNGTSINIPNPAITAIIATGTALAFQYVPMGDNKKLIAKYVSGVAGGARTLTGKESNDEATQLLLSYIPADIKAQYPPIGTIIIPQVIGYFESAKQQAGTNHQAFIDKMNAVAAGLEQGVAGFIK